MAFEVEYHDHHTDRQVEEEPRVRWSPVLAGMVVAAATICPARLGIASTSSARQPGVVLHSAPLQLPLAFQPNRGEVDPRVQFLARAGNGTVFLTSDGLVISTARRDRMQSPASAARKFLHHPGLLGGWTDPQVVRLTWESARSQAVPVGLHQLPGRVNYFIGSDPRRWERDVPTYAAIEYRDLYRGVDLVVHSIRSQLEYDWHVHAGADPDGIRVKVEGTGPLRLDEGGNLRLRGRDNPELQSSAIAYQMIGQRRRHVSVRYVVLSGHSFGIRLGPHDAHREVVVDPVVRFVTSLGTLADASSITVDRAGSLFMTGETYSDTFPGPSPIQAALHPGGDDIFIAKLNAAGTGILFGTYLGGTMFGSGVPSAPNSRLAVAEDVTPSQDSESIAIDSGGTISVTGETRASDFPVVNAIQPTFGGGVCPQLEDINGTPTLVGLACHDAFVVRLSSAGDRLIFSTYLGGSNEDTGYGVAVDAAGNSVVTGEARSSQFPLKNPLQGAHAGQGCTGYAVGQTPGAPEPCSDAFVTKFDPSGGLLFSTYLGGSADDAGNAVAVDGAGNSYVVGSTVSPDFPTVSPLPNVHADLEGTAFVTKINAAGTKVVYSTYFGSTAAVSEEPTDTTSTDVPTAETSGTEVAPATEAPLVESGAEGNAIAVDAAGHAYIAGTTWTPFLPTANALQPHLSAPGPDAYVAELTPSGTGLVFSTYLGGTSWEEGIGIAVDAGENIYVAGSTESTDFPTASSVKAAPAVTPDCADPTTSEEAGACSDAFVTRLGIGGKPLVYSTYLGGSDLDFARAIAVDDAGNAYVTGLTFSGDFPGAQPLPGQVLPGPDSPGVGGFILKLYDTPSATLTPTATQTPVATPKRAKAKPRQKCKKGYKLVKGKCKKTPVS